VPSRATFGVTGALLLCIAHAGALAAEDLSVEAERQGEGVDIRARATVAAPLPLVWEVLTDYEALPRFIPGIVRSSVLERRGNRVLIEQAGAARFLVFSFPIEIRLDVTENPPQWIMSHAAGGNLRRMSGRYDIEADAARGTCTLRYRGAIEPDFALPPLVGIAAMRGMVEEQFTAMIAEIERRAAAAPK
jgi:ribosome-associated toxin RatA of RatAB toxin-antitoxin module